MKVAVIGAAGKLGRRLVDAGLGRGHQVVAVCRHGSAAKLAEFQGRGGFSRITAAVVSDEGTLMRALDGCDAVVAVLISVRRLKATELVTALITASAATGVRRLAFTAGEVTAEPAAAEAFTLRQRLMRTLLPFIARFTPYDMRDMLRAADLVRKQPHWEWTIVRAPTLTEAPPTGYRFCDIADITSAHSLSREDYATALLDSLEAPAPQGRLLAVTSAGGDPSTPAAG